MSFGKTRLVGAVDVLGREDKVGASCESLFRRHRVLALELAGEHLRPLPLQPCLVAVGTLERVDEERTVDRVARLRPLVVLTRRIGWASTGEDDV